MCECLGETYLLRRAGAGVEEGSEAVVAVAASPAGRLLVGQRAPVSLVRVHHSVAGVDDAPLPGRGPHSVTEVDVPVGSQIRCINLGGRSLSKDGDRGQGRDKKPLESDHVDDVVCLWDVK